MHSEARDYVVRTLARFPPRDGAVIVDLGGRNVNGTLRDLFPQDAPYTAVDIRDGPGVDAVGDAATWRPDTPPDLVLCTEVLEHTAKAEAIVRNAWRMLPAGGLLILTTAWVGRAPHSAMDGGRLRDGEWYQNITASDLTLWLHPFHSWGIETEGGPVFDIRAWARKG